MIKTYLFWQILAMTMLIYNRVVCQSANGSLRAKQTQTFQNYKAIYGKNYNNPSQQLYRNLIVYKNVDKVEAHNAQKNKTFTMTLNQYSDLSQQQFLSQYSTLMKSSENVIKYVSLQQKKQAIIAQMDPNAPTSGGIMDSTSTGNQIQELNKIEKNLTTIKKALQADAAQYKKSRDDQLNTFDKAARNFGASISGLKGVDLAVTIDKINYDAGATRPASIIPLTPSDSMAAGRSILPVDIIMDRSVSSSNSKSTSKGISPIIPSANSNQNLANNTSDIKFSQKNPSDPAKNTTNSTNNSSTNSSNAINSSQAMNKTVMTNDPVNTTSTSNNNNYKINTTNNTNNNISNTTNNNAKNNTTNNNNATNITNVTPNSTKNTTNNTINNDSTNNNTTENISYISYPYIPSKFPTIHMEWTYYSGAVRSQGKCGMCYIITAVNNLQAIIYIKKGYFVQLSVQQILNCGQDPYISFGCQGGYVEGAFNYMRQYGILQEKLYSNTTSCDQLPTGFKIGETFFFQRGDCKGIKNTLFRSNPISVGIRSGGGFQFYGSGTFSNCVGPTNHAVLLVGFDINKGWKIKNSWGVTWGEQGYGWLIDGNSCNICDQARYPIYN